MAQSEDCASLDSHNTPVTPLYQLVNGRDRVCWGVVF